MTSDATGARVLDVSALPPYAFGHRSLLWWGTMGLVAIEGTVFALAIVSYCYLHGRSSLWPPGAPPPRLLYGTLNLVLLVLSGIPNQVTKSAAERLDLGRVRVWLVICCLAGLAFNLVRVWEFQSLNVRWDANAYGSIVWVLLGLHTTHILTDVADTIVLTVLMFTGPVGEKRFVDVSENALYWYFVILAWIPIYAVIYVAPRIW